MNGLEQQLKAAMQAVVDHLKQEFKSLRTGRANSSVLDKVSVEAYESRVPLKNVANITVPDARQILVTPFDVQTLHAIVKGIEAANIGLHPLIDGKIVRVPIPPMDEAVRKQMAKQCKDLSEKSKVAMREVRRKYNELIRKEKADGNISEDVMKKSEKTIQETTERFCREIDSVCSEKEKDVMTV